MNTTLRSIPLLLLSPVSFAADDPAPFEVVRQSAGLQADEAGFRASGPDYAARFRPGSVELVPALGTRAPRDMPLRLELASIHRGDGPVLAADAGIAPSRDGMRVEYRRGLGVVERYDVRPEGIEQSFLFPAPLPGEGDLEVRLRIETEHAGRPDGAGLLFETAGLGGVRVGAATGIDAAGRRVPGEVRLEGDEIALSLPAAWLDNASYPVVLDPLIGPVLAPGSSGFDESAPDVAYEASSDTYLVVWERGLSASSVEIRGQLVDGSTGQLVHGQLLIEGDAVNRRPSVGSCAATGHFLIAHERAPTIFGPWDVHARLVFPQLGHVLAFSKSIASSSADEVRPDVASSSDPSSPRLLVAVDLVGDDVRVVSVTTDTHFALAGSLSYVAQSELTRPKLSSGNGAWVLAYEAEGASGQSLLLDVLDDTATSIVNGINVAASAATGEEFAAALDGDGTDFVLAYQREEIAGRHDVFCRSYRFESGLLLSTSGEVTLSSSVAMDESSPAVAWAGDKVFVSWQEAVFPGFDYDLNLVELAPDCTPCGFETQVAAGGRNIEASLAAAVSSSSSAGDGAMIVWTRFDQGAPFAGEVMGQQLEAVGAGGAVSDLGGGCAGGGTASVGPVAIGNSGFTVELSGADPVAFFSILNLHVSQPAFSCGPCVALPLEFTFPAPIAGGSAQTNLPIPCDTGLVGGQIQFQWSVLGTAGSPCPLFPNVAVSNQLSVFVGL